MYTYIHTYTFHTPKPVTLCVTGRKLLRREVIASTHSPLLEIFTRFVVDTGAAILIIPKEYLNNAVIYPTIISLVSVNNVKIECSGQTVLNLALTILRREFTLTFIVANITKLLLGYNFLNHFGLMVDWKNNQQIDTTTSRQSNAEQLTCVSNVSVY